MDIIEIVWSGIFVEMLHERVSNTTFRIDAVYNRWDRIIVFVVDATPGIPK